MGAERELSVDVAVVGAGLAGLSPARKLVISSGERAAAEALAGG
jgi:monoamine oxidase